jgi:hypothetical protein
VISALRLNHCQYKTPPYLISFGPYARELVSRPHLFTSGTVARPFADLPIYMPCRVCPCSFTIRSGSDRYGRFTLLLIYQDHHVITQHTA